MLNKKKKLSIGFLFNHKLNIYFAKTYKIWPIHEESNQFCLYVNLFMRKDNLIFIL